MVIVLDASRSMEQSDIQPSRLRRAKQKIGELLALRDDGERRTRADVKALTQAHIDAVSQKIRDLQRLKRRLTQISSYCDGSQQGAGSCPILHSLFESGEGEPS